MSKRTTLTPKGNSLNNVRATSTINTLKNTLSKEQKRVR
jgi:hypothetical protein